jgi:hypothetical protein
MPRYLIGVVAAVVAIALVGVGVSVYRQWTMRPPSVTVAETEPGQALDNPPPPALISSKPPAPKREGSRAPAPPAAAVLPNNAASPSNTSVAQTIRDQEMARRQASLEESKYRLPSANLVGQLGRTTDPSLRLTAEQQAKVQALTTGFRPKMDAALLPVWRQTAQLDTTISNLVAQGKQEQARKEAQQYTEIYQQEAAAREDLDAQYKTLLSQVLRPEQMEMLSGNLTPQQTQRLFNSP